jgi:hypothetical protein
MPHTIIPEWTAQGCLPPVNPYNPTGTDRSPYKVGLVDLVLHFSTSERRSAILHGFLRFRQRLHSLGLTRGFQWLDGSFMEHVETLDNRSPNDLDVVTFAHLPEGVTQATILQQEPTLFNPKHSKTEFLVDSYLEQLNDAPAEYLVNKSRYWYSVWSHRRSGQWKGYLEVDLNPQQDAAALENLHADNTGEEKTV